MERKNKPTTIPIAPSIPQASIDVSDSTITATLPSGDSVTVHLFGATVISWTTPSSPSGSSPTEHLFLSSASKLDSSKAIRGGIPIVFPNFGPAPKDHATSKLPQHGFARSSSWEFLGKNSSEGEAPGKKATGDGEIKLDFGLGADMLSEEVRAKWPYQFGLVYTVTLGTGYLETGLQVQNQGEEVFEFQALFHNYFAVDDISQSTVTGLESKPIRDKVSGADVEPYSTNSPAGPISVPGPTDTIFSGLTASEPVTIVAAGKPQLALTREGLEDLTVWNPWEEGAKGMGDFEPKDGYKKMLCVEPGSIRGWVKLEGKDAWEGRQVVKVL